MKIVLLFEYLLHCVEVVVLQSGQKLPCHGVENMKITILERAQINNIEYRKCKKNISLTNVILDSIVPN